MSKRPKPKPSPEPTKDRPEDRLEHSHKVRQETYDRAKKQEPKVVRAYEDNLNERLEESRERMREKADNRK